MKKGGGASKKKKGGATKSPSSDSSSSEPPPPAAGEVGGKTSITTEKLVEQGNNALMAMQPELAVKFFQRAYDMDSNDTNIMDALADVHMQLGAQEHALELLLKSTSLAPEINPFKWLYLAQLQMGTDSVQTYLKAIEIMGKANINIHDDQQMYQKQTVKAYCSIAELYLTDLCYEENAEGKCEEYVSQALVVDPDSLDGQQVLANLRISQCRTTEAAEIIEKLYQKIKSIREKLASRTVIDEMTGTDIPEDVKDAPELEFYIATAKYMVECATVVPVLAEYAMELVTSLLHDDDENIELWYIMGVAALSCRPPDREGARYHLDTAKTMMETLLENMMEQVRNVHLLFALEKSIVVVVVEVKQLFLSLPLSVALLFVCTGFSLQRAVQSSIGSSSDSRCPRNRRY